MSYLQSISKHIVSFVVWLTLATSCAASGAQTERLSGMPRIEIDSDLRVRLPSQGKARTELTKRSFRLDTAMGSGIKLDFYGAEAYEGFLVQKATIENRLGPGRLQSGIIRLPFGIYDYQETYASGIIDYPLARVDAGWNSVDWGVPGAVWSGGGPRLQVEAAGFDGRASGVWGQTNNVGGASVRLQTFLQTGLGDVILGASHWDGFFDIFIPQPFGPGNLRRSVHEHGVDIRFTRPHLLIRGEYLFGMLGSEQMHGGYLDVYYHLPKFQQWTLAARLEALRPGSGDRFAKQATVGARYTAGRDWILTANWRKNNGSDFYPYSWTPPAGHAGDLFFQVYRKIRL